MPVSEICLRNINKEIFSGHLKMGGTNPEGKRLDVTNYYIEFDGNPFLIIAGEFQYSRYDCNCWEWEILKMKMAGLNTITSYVFWIHHEEEEGIFIWEKDKNLKRFLDICKTNNMFVILRIGPFVHGECRNGGLPDWLFAKPFRVRSNDEGYLESVKKFYQEIGQQSIDYLFKNGGTVIGVQLENEYMHAGAPWEFTYKQDELNTGIGYDGVEHMVKLKQLAQEAGLEVPIYTCTGWGGSPVIENEMIPVFGGYAFRPWIINETNKIHPPTDNYIFKNLHDGNYPYACNELGAGMQSWYNYRFVVPPESVEGIAIQRLAGGCNILGYYMFHGGSNPTGNNCYLNEHKCPKISYDFQAPIGEYGQIRQSYHFLRLLHMFLDEFGTFICQTATVLPQEAPLIHPENTSILRYAVRVKDKSGFIFINNYQDHCELNTLCDIRIKLNANDEELYVPAIGGINLAKGITAIFPFNIKLGDITLKYSTTQLLTRIKYNEDHYFFFAPEGINAEYCFDNEGIYCIDTSCGEIIEEKPYTIIKTYAGLDSVVKITGANKTIIYVHTITRSQALSSWKINFNKKETLVITDADSLIEKNGCLYLETRKNRIQLYFFPTEYKLVAVQNKDITKDIISEKEGFFSRFNIDISEKNLHFDIDRIDSNRVEISFKKASFEGIEDIILRIEYEGDIGYAFIGNKLINDNFFNGQIWEIGLKRYFNELAEKDIYIFISPIRKGKVIIKDISMAMQQQFIGEEIANIKQISPSIVYKISIFQESCKGNK